MFIRWLRAGALLLDNGRDTGGGPPKSAERPECRVSGGGIVDTLDRIRALIAKEFNLNEADLRPDSRLEDFGLDSLAVIEFMFTLESEFDIVLSEERERIQTLGDIVQMVDRLRQERAAGSAS